MTEEEIFLAALDLSDPRARAAYLTRACGADAELRQQVESLLAAHFKEGAFLDEPLGQQLGGAPNPVGDPFRTRVAARGGDASGGGAPDDEPVDLSFLRPSARADSLGRIGRYDALQVLGVGGFGIVFRAVDEVLQRVVAIKVLAPALAVTSPARQRFLREARASAAIRHENVVQVYEIGEQPLPYLVMEFIPGESLQQRLDRTGPLAASEIVRFGRQVAEGLAAAHATGLIHRDITPGNILIEPSPSERVKLTDFGLARATDDASLTQSGTLAGTPMYMAPEQVRGEPLDHRADLFSLGSVLYQTATGRPPFRAATTFAVLKRVVEDSPRPVREVIPELPQWLAGTIAKLHAKDPADRFQSARELADVFAAYEALLKANARPEEFVRVRPGEHTPGKSGRRKWGAAALLVPVVALALAGAAGVTRWSREAPPPPGPVEKNDGALAPPERPGAASLPLEYTNTLGMTFRLVPAGTFTMGTSREEIDHWVARVPNDARKLALPSEGPEHEVEITQPFYLGVTEVTVRQFRQYADAHPDHGADHRWQKLPFRQTDEHPVVFVDWPAAVDFCNWVSEKEGRQYRLPTEAEWEYSCRAGKARTRYCYGNDEAELGRYAWYDKNSDFGTKPVGQKAPNDWGLFDMHGNAWEWCRDFHDLKYYASSPAQDPTGPTSGTDHVKRGGAWSFGAVDARAAFRSYRTLSVDCGFRVLLVVPPGSGPIKSRK